MRRSGPIIPNPLARLGAFLDALGVDYVITPAPPGSDHIDQLRGELGAIRWPGSGVPVYHPQQLRREKMTAAVDLVARTMRDGEIPLSSEIDGAGAPEDVVQMARDLAAAWLAETECDPESQVDDQAEMQVQDLLEVAV